MPPPPLPPGWFQAWEPSIQRAYFVEEPTGRSQWEPPGAGPYGAGEYGSPLPPGAEGEEGAYEDPEQRKKSDKKKYLAAGAAGLALGAAGGAFIAHEMGMLGFVSLLCGCGANWSQVKIVTALPTTTTTTTKRRRASASTGSKRGRRRIIRTVGRMSIPRRRIGDC